MSIDTTKQAILNYFVSAWGATSPITLDNEDFDPETEGGDEWVRVSIREFASGQKTLGKITNRKFRRVGSVFVQVFTKEGEGGTQPSDTLAETARGILEGTNQVAGVCFFAATVRTQPPDDYWYRVVVEVEFSYDETK